MTGGHLDVARRQAQVQRRAYWVNWTADVQHEIKSFNPCAQYFRGTPPRSASLRPMLVGELFERIAIDITGRHPKSRNGNEYMFTVMDHFGKWAEACPLRDHKVPTVAKVLVEQLFKRFGMPYQLLSDQGPEFGSDIFLEMCRWVDIDTGYTPNFLTLGRETQAPLDIVLDPPKEETDLWDSHDSFIADQQERMRIAYAAAREILQRCAERRKKTYELRVRKQEVISGAWVWYYYPRRWIGRSPK